MRLNLEHCSVGASHAARMRRSARRSALLASLLLAPRETAAAACGDGPSHLRDWLCQLTVSWPDSTLVASTEGRTELLYLSLAGSVCSQIRLGAVSSSRSRLENATELSAKFTGFDLQCDMDGLAVSDKPPKVKVKSRSSIARRFASPS